MSWRQPAVRLRGFAVGSQYPALPATAPGLRGAYFAHTRHRNRAATLCLSAHAGDAATRGLEGEP